MTQRPAVLYLIRHGQTELNAAGLLRGQLDPPLDATGRTEAAELGNAFANVPLVAVVTSPLRRATQTAETLAPGVPLHIEAGLADRDYGPWAGAAAEDVVGRFGSLDGAPGIEPAPVFTERVSTAVRAIADRWKAGPVAVVAHDAVNRHVLAALVPALGDPEAIGQRTGCWSRLERAFDRWTAPIVDAVPADGRHP